MHKQHGIAFSFGQLMEVATAILTALPKALKSIRGVNPKELLKVINHNGELLELGLGELLSSMIRRSHPQGAAATSNDQPRPIPRRAKRTAPIETVTIDVPAND